MVKWSLRHQVDFIWSGSPWDANDTSDKLFDSHYRKTPSTEENVLYVKIYEI